MVLMPASTVAPLPKISSVLANTQGGRSPANSSTFDLGRPGKHIASRIAGLVRIQAPFRLRCGVHGNRVPAQELPPE